MLRHTSLLCAVTSLFVALSFATAAASSAIPPVTNPYAPVMVVLDSSGSMKARDAGGTGTRLDAAKRAVGTMVVPWVIAGVAVLIAIGGVTAAVLARRRPQPGRH